MGQEGDDRMDVRAEEVTINGTKRKKFYIVDGIGKRQIAFMDEECYKGAKLARQRQNPQYPDMRQLTEESKKIMRKVISSKRT